MQILIQLMSILQTPAAVCLVDLTLWHPCFLHSLQTLSDEDIQDNYEGHSVTSETADRTLEEITQVNLKNNDIEGSEIKLSKCSNQTFVGP